MQRLITLLVGVALGWSAHSFYFQFRFWTDQSSDKGARGQAQNTRPFRQEALSGSNEELRFEARPDDNGRLNNGRQSGQSQKSHTPVNPIDTATERLNRYLSARQYRQAVEFIVHMMNQDERVGTQLKSVSMAFMNKLLASDDFEGVQRLSEEYLSVYYNDIPAILLLADYYQNRGFYTEVINTYQLAFTYAQKTSDSVSTQRKFAAFISDVNLRLSGRNEWAELQRVYQIVEEAGLLSVKYQLKLASILVLNGETYEAIALLTALENDPAYGKLASDMLKSLSEDSFDAESEVASGLPEVVQLTKRHDQYVARLKLTSASVDVDLLLDTGASFVTLTRSVFERLKSRSPRADITFVEQRRFNTANGQRVGNVYRVSQLQFGNYTLYDKLVSVMDTPMGQLDGLLGMNVLSEFKFHLDQDKSKLYLERRYKGDP